MSYNMHGYNQGVTVLKLLIESKHTEVIMLQEHCLTHSNLYKFSQDFSLVFWFYLYGFKIKIFS